MVGKGVRHFMQLRIRLESFKDFKIKDFLQKTVNRFSVSESDFSLKLSLSFFFLYSDIGQLRLIHSDQL